VVHETLRDHARAMAQIESYLALWDIWYYTGTINRGPDVVQNQY